MADFTHPGWGYFVAIVTVLSILACFVLAYSLASRKTPGGGGGTTGHVWDEDLEELNNPLPRWWLYLFYITCVFGIAYLLMYPGLGAYKGLLGWSSAGKYEEEVEEIRAVTEPLFNKFLATDIAEVAKDPAAVDMGERLYLTYCTQCHGSDARGSRSFPNLTDNDWLGMGDGNYVKSTVMNGRNAVMPPMGAALGSDEEIDNVVHYVLSLSGSNHDAAKAEKGKIKYAVCGACHGQTGGGNPAIGAPNLADDTWLFGGSEKSIASAIKNGVSNSMPPFGELLGEGKAHVVSAYVMSLSANNK